MIVDFCTYVGDWPTYELPHRTADGLLFLMDRCGIGAACVSLMGDMFRFDARESNERLMQAIAGHRDRLWPIGTLDPTIPTWRDDLEHGLGGLNLAGFRLHPNYHGYVLDRPDVLDLASQLADARRPLFVALNVEQEVFQHPSIRVADVPVAHIVWLIQNAPRTTIVLNNFKLEHASPLLETGISLDNVYLDINAMDFPFDALQLMKETYGVGRLVFGSQMPFLYPEAALMVLEYSGLSPVDIEAVLEQNWQYSPVLAELAIRPLQGMT